MYNSFLKKFHNQFEPRFAEAAVEAKDKNVHCTHQYIDHDVMHKFTCRFVETMRFTKRLIAYNGIYTEKW